MFWDEDDITDETISDSYSGGLAPQTESLNVTVYSGLMALVMGLPLSQFIAPHKASDNECSEKTGKDLNVTADP